MRRCGNGLKFGREIANRLLRRSPSQGDTWHLDEVALTIAGQRHWLWRAVDQDGFVLDVLVQSRRNRKAARRLMRKLMKRPGTPGAGHRQAEELCRHR